VPAKPCVFCDILAGRAPAHFVLDEEACVAFLDRHPVFPGHVLVVPRAHRETVSDLTPAEGTALFDAVRRTAGAVERGLGADGSFLAMNNRVSQSVPHAHFHVVPRRRGDGLRGFFWPRHAYESDAAAAEVAAKIRAELSGS
jgi:histidine triad (HIT) family protein